MSRQHALIVGIVAAFAIAGCAESSDSLPQAERSSSETEGLHTVLCMKVDPARGRRWELGWGAVFGYDDASGKFIRRIPLTGATFIGTPFVGRPDLLVSRSGEVIVSSNAEPVLWRIDPVSFEVRRYAIVTDTDRDKDFGFRALAWNSDESVLYATSTFTGTVWRVDLESATASKV